MYDISVNHDMFGKFTSVQRFKKGVHLYYCLYDMNTCDDFFFTL